MDNNSLDMVQRSLNSKRNLFNTVVFILLPASLVYAFIYSILLTRERKVDYLLFVAFVTVSYTLVVMLVDLLQTDSDSIGIKYLINKLNLDDDVDVDISISIDNQKNMCDLNFNYPDRNNPGRGLSEIELKAEKVINGEKLTSDININNQQDKDFYNRCDSLTDEDKLSQSMGQCIGYDSSSMGECSSRIRQSKDPDEAFNDCVQGLIRNENKVWIMVGIGVLTVVIVGGAAVPIPWFKEIKDIYNIILPVLLTIYGLWQYFNSDSCHYVDIVNSDISVSPFSKEFLSYWLVYLVPQTIAYIGIIFTGASNDFTTPSIFILLLSSIYVINDYSFLSVLESNYASFGKFINVMKLDRSSDRMNYNLSFKDRNTNKRCVIDGIWDKTAQSPEITGDMAGCNSDNLGKNLGLMM